MLLEALGAGGDGYLIKRADQPEIIQAIRAVRRGDVYVHPAMTRALLGLMGKLGLSSRVELVTYAEEHGLL